MEDYAPLLDLASRLAQPPFLTGAAGTLSAYVLTAMDQTSCSFLAACLIIRRDHTENDPSVYS